MGVGPERHALEPRVGAERLPPRRHVVLPQSPVGVVVGLCDEVIDREHRVDVPEDGIDVFKTLVATWQQHAGLVEAVVSEEGVAPEHPRELSLAIARAGVVEDGEAGILGAVGILPRSDLGRVRACFELRLHSGGQCRCCERGPDAASLARGIEQEPVAHGVAPEHPHRIVALRHEDVVGGIEADHERA